MKEPKSFSTQESLLNPFVVAANAPSLQSACDLLGVGSHDLMNISEVNDHRFTHTCRSKSVTAACSAFRVTRRSDARIQ
jgi:hypothetical protein